MNNEICPWNNENQQTAFNLKNQILYFNRMQPQYRLVTQNLHKSNMRKIIKSVKRLKTDINCKYDHKEDIDNLLKRKLQIQCKQLQKQEFQNISKKIAINNRGYAKNNLQTKSLEHISTINFKKNQTHIRLVAKNKPIRQQKYTILNEKLKTMITREQFLQRSYLQRQNICLDSQTSKSKKSSFLYFNRHIIQDQIVGFY